jgi:hypothetical protein
MLAELSVIENCSTILSFLKFQFVERKLPDVLCRKETKTLFKIRVKIRITRPKTKLNNNLTYLLKFKTIKLHNTRKSLKFHEDIFQVNSND